MFKSLAIFNGSLLLSMFLQRLVLFLLVVRHWVFDADGVSIGMSFFNGSRFDLCVLGFINIPVLFFTWWVSSDAMGRTENPVLKWLRRWALWTYLGFASLAIHVLGLLDLMFFAANHQRWTYFNWQEGGLAFISRAASAWGGVFTLGVVGLFLMLWVFRSLFVLYKLQIHLVPEPKESLGKSTGLLVFTGLILPFFVTALAARGTWTAHHINMEHAQQVSDNSALVQMALSPVWAFDKKF